MLEYQLFINELYYHLYNRENKTQALIAERISE
jgi:hypothetical protein